MSILTRVTDDLSKARMAKDKSTLEALQVILGEFQRVSKDIQDTEAITILRKLKQSVEEVIKYDKSDTHARELELYASYLPIPVTSETIEQWLIENVDFSSLRNPMMAIGLVKKAFDAGSVDGKEVKTIITKLTKRQPKGKIMIKIITTILLLQTGLCSLVNAADDPFKLAKLTKAGVYTANVQRVSVKGTTYDDDVYKISWKHHTSGEAGILEQPIRKNWVFDAVPGYGLMPGYNKIVFEGFSQSGVSLHTASIEFVIDKAKPSLEVTGGYSQTIDYMYFEITGVARDDVKIREYTTTHNNNILSSKWVWKRVAADEVEFTVTGTIRRECTGELYVQLTDDIDQRDTSTIRVNSKVYPLGRFIRANWPRRVSPGQRMHIELNSTNQDFIVFAGGVELSHTTIDTSQGYTHIAVDAPRNQDILGYIQIGIAGERYDMPRYFIPVTNPTNAQGGATIDTGGEEPIFIGGVATRIKTTPAVGVTVTITGSTLNVTGPELRKLSIKADKPITISYMHCESGVKYITCKNVSIGEIHIGGAVRRIKLNYGTLGYEHLCKTPGLTHGVACDELGKVIVKNGNLFGKVYAPSSYNSRGISLYASAYYIYNGVMSGYFVSDIINKISAYTLKDSYIVSTSVDSAGWGVKHVGACQFVNTSFGGIEDIAEEDLITSSQVIAAGVVLEDFESCVANPTNTFVGLTTSGNIKKVWVLRFPYHTAVPGCYLIKGDRSTKLQSKGPNWARAYWYKDGASPVDERGRPSVFKEK